MTANVERIAAPAVKPNAVSHVTGWLRRRMARWMTPKGPDYMASGSYRYLARHIHTDLPGRDGGRTILISATADVAANNDAILMLSYFLRDELGCRILLIDGTFRGEGVGAVLGHGDERGFFDLAYGDERTIADVAQPTRNRDIFVVPAGRSPGAGLPPIQPERIARLFRDARANFDYILLQQGRIFEDSRYLVFTGQADLILMMVDEGKTQLREMEQCMSDQDTGNPRPDRAHARNRQAAAQLERVPKKLKRLFRMRTRSNSLKKIAISYRSDDSI